MAMDALKHLAYNVPGWLNRLDDLSDQIERRQAELLAVAAAEGESVHTKSLRNKGSTESLNPGDDVPIAVTDGNVPGIVKLKHSSHVDSESCEPLTPATETKEDQTADSPPHPSTVQQSHEVVRTGYAQRQQLKRKRRSASMRLTGDSPQMHRTQSMIMVYYDSYVESFFDELVRFVCSSRSLMRKTRMAAKIAQIGNLAELDASQNSEDNGGAHGIDMLPLLSNISAYQDRPMSSTSRPAFGPRGKDVCDILDDNLETVQKMCEQGAHQFLRDGGCNDEIEKAQKKLEDVLEMVTNEIEQMQREEPERAEQAAELGMAQPLSSIVKHYTQSTYPQVDLATGGDAQLDATRPGDPRASSPKMLLEIDPDFIEAGKNIDVDIVPNLQHRSAKAMQNHAP